MTAVQFSCPHCSGAFQIDPSMAGGQVACPLCQGVVGIPPMQSNSATPPNFAQMPPPTAPVMPPPPPTPATSLPPTIPPTSPPSETPQASKLSCPLCAGVFQVGNDMAGKTVACPHCSGHVAVPGFEPAHNPPSAENDPAHSPISTNSSNPPLPTTALPTNQSPVDEMFPPPTTPPQPVERESVSDPHTLDGKNVDDLFPPGFLRGGDANPTNAVGPAPTNPIAESPETNTADFLPPGVTPSLNNQTLPSDSPTASDFLPPQVQDQNLPPNVLPSPSEDVASPETGTTIVQQSEQKIPQPNDYLPPQPTSNDSAKSDPARATPSTTDYLPPGMTTSTTESSQATVPADQPGPSKPTAADDLLPPGAMASTPSSSSNQAAPTPGSAADSLLPPGAISVKATTVEPQRRSKADDLLPPGAEAATHTAPGKQVSLPTKESDATKTSDSPDSILIPDDDGQMVEVQAPKKTIRRGNTELELKTISPDEKKRRRFIRNIIMWSFCAVVLGIAMVVLTMIN